MQLPRFAVVDLETSGFSARWSRILQIAVVTVEPNGALVDEWSTMVKSRWPLQRVGPTHIHGISRSALRGAPTLQPTVREFERRTTDALFTAHNAEFDRSFLRRATRRHLRGESNALTNVLCTLRMSRQLDLERRRSHRLGDLCDFYGVGLDRPHDALADARATAAILPHLLSDLGITEREQLEPFLISTVRESAPRAHARR